MFANSIHDMYIQNVKNINVRSLTLVELNRRNIEMDWLHQSYPITHLNVNSDIITFILLLNSYCRRKYCRTISISIERLYKQ